MCAGDKAQPQGGQCLGREGVSKKVCAYGSLDECQQGQAKERQQDQAWQEEDPVCFGASGSVAEESVEERHKRMEYEAQA